MLQSIPARLRRLNWIHGLMLGLAGVGILSWQARYPIHSLMTNLLEIVGVGAVVVCVHVLVYLNGADWIEADPEAKRVLLLSSCCDDNP